MSIRAIAIALIEHQESIFVFEGYDPVKDSIYYRPLGGGIDFGEPSRETLVREFKEEMGTDIAVDAYIDTLENIFTYKGRQGHEYVRLYSAHFLDSKYLENKVFTAVEDSGKTFKALWVPKADFISGEKRLVPERLVELLKTDS